MTFILFCFTFAALTSFVNFPIKKRYILSYTRGSWKVLSMVFYLSNVFTNPILCLVSFLILQYRQVIYYCEYKYCLYTRKRKFSVENITFYPLKSVQNINNKFVKLYNFESFCRPQFGTVIKQLMTELDVSNN